MEAGTGYSNCEASNYSDAIAHLVVRVTTRIWSLSPAIIDIILDFNDEHGFVIVVEYDKEDDPFKVSGVFGERRRS